MLAVLVASKGRLCTPRKAQVKFGDRKSETHKTREETERVADMAREIFFPEYTSTVR